MGHSYSGIKILQSIKQFSPALDSVLVHQKPEAARLPTSSGTTELNGSNFTCNAKKKKKSNALINGPQRDRINKQETNVK